MHLCKKNTSSTAPGFVEVDSSGCYTIWVSDGDFYQKDSSPGRTCFPAEPALRCNTCPVPTASHPATGCWQPSTEKQHTLLPSPFPPHRSTDRHANSGYAFRNYPVSTRPLKISRNLEKKIIGKQWKTSQRLQAGHIITLPRAKVGRTGKK